MFLKYHVYTLFENNRSAISEIVLLLLEIKRILSSGIGI